MDAISKALTKVKKTYNFDFHLKDKQLEIITSIINGKDVFALLPTGFGKSLTFTMIPLILDELYPENSHTSVIISPLKALMSDQVELLRKHNIKVDAITENSTIKDIRDGDLSILFASPEAALSTKWKRILQKTFENRISVLVFDEAHCISSWGSEFRPIYREVSTLQSFFNVPNLVLTATATKNIQDDIYEILGFQDEKTDVIAALPDRPNIFIDIVESTEKFETELHWLYEHLKNNGNKKIIVYVMSIKLCYCIFLWFVTSLMNECYTEQEISTRKVEMFHANTDSQSKTRIMDDFMNNDGSIKVLISTAAFGMGVNIKDVDIVVHWGVPSTCLNYWQEMGRCARDQRRGYAICYAFKRSLSKCKDSDLKTIVKMDMCIRWSVLKIFQLEGMEKSHLIKIHELVECHGQCVEQCECKQCKCCSVCQKLCTCKAKVHETLNEFLKQSS